ncbi:putative pectinesterase/pectinesterase inhibitor 16 [Acorus gramineus]|uniref:Pectinesterase n=1 Tax=Acorus gramineus TaxID=55184 RepID=A0AAV9BTN5_ACOGR|nr:putative pectinesterase/pectinesterase inhibitor 16 [Acorus gramineus]
MCSNTNPLNMCQTQNLIVLLTLTLISYTSHATRDINPSHTSASSIVVTACKTSLHPSTCESSLASLAGTTTHDKSPKELFDLSVQFAMGQAHSALSSVYNLTLSGLGKPTGLDDCLELLDLSQSQLSDALDPSKTWDDVHTWLSAAMTNQDTCVDGLQSMGRSTVRDSVEAQAQSLARYISNSLALHVSIADGGHQHVEHRMNGGFPGWVMERDRRLLEAAPVEIEADAVVAKDGSGTHRTIGEAIASLAGGGGGRSTVYVKAGTYMEILRFTKKQRNVMLYGDGAGKTVIVGDRSAESGWTTYASATVSAMGPGFIAKDLSIVNSAGPSKHQAVALRIGADMSVIYRCSIQGYQDTLYTHSNRQFYRDDDIYGTVDFIFGNSAVVFQNSNIHPRRPNPAQKNTITAQGRRDPNQNTGENLRVITAASDLVPVKHAVETYLGRPWHEYSRTVIIGTYLDDSISPAGWTPWAGEFGLKTLYYGEYLNTGPGAGTSGRVGWPGVHRALTTMEAVKFTVAQFILGNAWLPGTGVVFNAGL